MGKVFLFGPLILTNNWGFRTNILNISLDGNFPYIHDILMGIRSVSPISLIVCTFMISRNMKQVLRSDNKSDPDQCDNYILVIVLIIGNKLIG